MDTIPRTTANRETLGRLIRRMRLRSGWTLQQMGEIVGTSVSTLSKIERNQLSPTYEKLQQFSSRLGMTVPEFLADLERPAPGSSGGPVTGRRSLARNGNSVVVSTLKCDYEYLCAELREKRMVPILVRIKARAMEEFGEPLKHTGEEFVLVIEGTVELHMDFYTPVTLTEGEWVYLDGEMGHAYLAKGCDSAVVLTVRSQ